jgi:hypothetical protein
VTRIVVFRALTVLIGGLCRHIRLHVRVVGGDLSFASIFHNHLQQSCPETPFIIGRLVPGCGFGIPVTEASTSTTATSGRTNLNETMSCRSVLPWYGPLKMSHAC